ncbi:CYTH and CHAD domain-containing protein [Rhodopseudomonas sp. P2A-2r]|uniref:CYTH and CHAD domain-containing protein n=1 Tax=unclassified Rhodopseudomonas TaxID=2638247 RepID=UPI00223435B5|nr:CHAD domain-containing protein [Rhodopseudomonas sp. P2A-2r]UZE49338.1 CHAD domain-containing protein [Rhodopseudomonas sp. P2A-2r]
MEKGHALPPSPSNDPDCDASESAGDSPAIAGLAELTFDVTAADILRLSRHPLLRDRLSQSRKAGILRSTYLDTRDHAFGRAGFSFRLHGEAGGLVQTIEAPRLGILQRCEQHTTSSAGEPSVPDHLIARLCGDRLPTALQSVFTTETTRRSCRLGGVKVSLDSGRINAGDSVVPFHAVVLELTRGRRAALFDVARQIQAIVPADISVRSPAQAGYQLLNGDKIVAIKASAIALTPTMSAAEAVTTVFGACLSQLLANRAGVCAGDADALHAMRVAARRLDAAIRVFSEVLSADEPAIVARELKWIGGELGKAREFDVFLAEAVRPLMKAHPRRKSVAELHRTFARQRAMAYRRVKTALTSDRFRAFALRAVEWADGSCINDVYADSKASAVVAEELTRQKRKMRNGRHLDELDPAQRHKLRLRAKRMRYATELTRGIFDGKRNAPSIDRSLVALERLQTALGELNDQAGWKEMLDAAAEKARRTRRAPPARSLVRQLLARDGQSEAEALLKTSIKAYRAFARTDKFWVDDEND